MIHLIYPFLIGLISNLMWPTMVRSVSEGRVIRASALAFVNGLFFIFFVKSLEHGISSGVSWCVGLSVGMFVALSITERKKKSVIK